MRSLLLRFVVPGLALALGGALSACSRLEPVTISRVLLDLPEEYDGRPEDRESLRAAIYGRLADDESITFTPGKDGGSHVLHVRVQASRLVPAPMPKAATTPAKAEASPDAGAVDPGAEELVADDGEDSDGDLGEPDRPMIEVRPLEVRLRPLGKSAELIATGRGDLDLGRIGSVVDAFDDAWSAIRRFRRLQRVDDDDLIAVLADPDARVRQFAIGRLGDKKSKAALTPLCEALGKEDQPELVLRAVGALVSIGDERAVPALIDLTRRKPPELVSQILYALGSIGGREAEAFLVTVASGHPSELVQASAKEALGDLQRRGSR